MTSTEQHAVTGQAGEHPEPRWLAAWLERSGELVEGPLAIEPLGDGKSNITLVVSDSARGRWVVRRPPTGTLLASAHDVLREARIMKGLEHSAVPTPKILGTREDVDGVPWVLMEHVEGLVLDRMDRVGAVPLEERRAIGLDMARTLAGVHAVDLDQVGLADLASHAPYAPRQLRRWSRQWQQSKTRELPALDALTARLAQAVPAQAETVLVHGDFHVRNVVTRDGRVVAALDWELSTIGDPLADLGTLLAYWPHRGDLAAMDRTSPTTMDGFASRAELVAEYAAVTGRDVSDVGFWHVLGLWKVAIIGEGVLSRALDSASISTDARSLAHEIEAMVRFGTEVADQVL